MTGTTPDKPTDDAGFDRLMARGGLHALPLPAPDVWPHGPLPADEKTLTVGEDSLSAQYCTFQGHRFLRAHLLVPIREARTVLGFETWGSVSEETWSAWLAARAGGRPFGGAFAWLANTLAGFETAEPVPCNLTAGPPGMLPRLQPHPGSELARAQAEGIDRARARRVIDAAAGRDLPATSPF